jgi:hypothetical protein
VRWPPTAGSARRMYIGATWLDQADLFTARRQPRPSAWDSKRAICSGEDKENEGKTVYAFRAPRDAPRKTRGRNRVAAPFP